MSNFKDISSCMKEMESRYNNTEKVRKKLANYNDPIQVTFLDTGRNILILVNGDQGLEVKDNTVDDSAPVKIEFVSEQILMDLYNKEVGAVKAYSSGEIKIVEGKIRNLLKLKTLMF